MKITLTPHGWVISMDDSFNGWEYSGVPNKCPQCKIINSWVEADWQDIQKEHMAKEHLKNVHGLIS